MSIVPTKLATSDTDQLSIVGSTEAFVGDKMLAFFNGGPERSRAPVSDTAGLLVAFTTTSAGLKALEVVGG